MRRDQQRDHGRVYAISIHAPLAGRDENGNPICPVCGISIHAPLAGRDTISQRGTTSARNFNPRAPCGARPRGRAAREQPHRFQSTRPLRGATMIGHGEWLPYLFQSTRPLRGATAAGMVLSPPRPHFNPRAPCGARRDRRRGDYARADISIHAPLAGRDEIADVEIMLEQIFQSTRPLRGATQAVRDGKYKPIFQSTRPLRGATAAMILATYPPADFNPRAPCGARLKELQDRLTEIAFQSTRPLRGATVSLGFFVVQPVISIHAPLAGCDFSDPFFPASLLISIHAPLAGCDDVIPDDWYQYNHFNPRTPCGVRRQLLSPGVNDMPLFQSTHPLRGATV